MQWRWCWQGDSAAAWRGEVHRPARRSPAGKDITAEEWQQFVDRDVTPRFRDGLTVFDAHGQWLGQNGQVVREQSKALMVIHGHDAQSEAGIEALRQGYKSRFAQESVMRVDQPVCVQF